MQARNVVGRPMMYGVGASSSCQKPLKTVTLSLFVCYLLRSVHGRGQEWDNWEHVLEGVDELREREDGDGECRVVQALDHQLALKEDQGQDLKRERKTIRE